MKIQSILLLLTAFASLPLKTVAKAPTWQPLPELEQKAAWKAGEGTVTLKLDNAEGALAATFDTAKESKAEQLLAKPLEVPEWADDFTFVCSADRRPSQVLLDMILQDDDGKRWYAKVKAPGTSSYHKNLGVINTGQLKGRPERLTVPSLSGPMVIDFRGTGERIQPVPRPWKVLGFRWVGDRLPNHSADPATLYLSKFAFSALRPGNSEYSGLFQDRSFYSELDGLPGIPLADIYSEPGTYEVVWKIFGDYAGTPLSQATARFDLGPKASNKPLALQLAQTIDMPKMPQGTYWVRWRARRLAQGGTLPVASEIAEKEQRLYVASNGAASVSKKNADGASANSDEWLQVAPLGQRFIAKSGEPFGLVMKCRKPDGYTGSGTLKVTVKTPNLGTEKKNLSLPVAWDASNLQEIKIDLSDLPAGPYTVAAELTIPEGLLDRCTLMAGLQAKEEAGGDVPLKQLPKGVPDWKTALNRPTPFFHLTPMVHSVTANFKEKTRWDWLSHFLDQAGTVSHDVEPHFSWKLIEPLPGVFDWEELELFLNKSAELNLQVMLAPEFWGSEPEWLPSIPTMNKDGRIFFDFAYNYHNTRQNYAQSPVLKKELSEAIAGLVKFARNHPAVQGYFVIQELPADAEWMNWHEGFDDLTLSNYRRHLASAFPNLKALSQRWNRPVKSVQTVVPPERSASPCEQLDWLRFRADGADSVMEMLIDTVRKHDPLRLIFVYGDIFGTRLSPEKLTELGCALGNGGSHDAMHPFSVSQDGLNNMVARTEDHWPGKWTGYFPEVLDASVFAMSYGGGKAMNCHHFMFTFLPEKGRDYYPKFDDLRQHPYSLDRFEKFQPIWGALRQTERLPVDVIELLSTDAGLLVNGMLSRNGLWDGQAQLACYRSHINFGANELPYALKGKLLLMTKDRLDSFPREALDQIKDYVAKGGHLLMLPRAGRKCVESPNDDWVLLREFGFNAPFTPAAVKGSFAVSPAAESGFGTSPLGVFNLGGRFEHSLAADEQVVASFQQYPDQAALTWKPFGRGQVAVLWSETLPPRGEEKSGTSGNVLGAAAEWAGSEPIMASSTPLFWLNLLKANSGGDYFGLAHMGVWAGQPTQGISGTVRYRLDADAIYAVSELITGKEIGKISGKEIWAKGLPLQLTPRQVAIFKFKKL